MFKKQCLLLVSLCCFKSMFPQTYNMAAGATITTCAGTFYDSGGSGGSYANNLNITRTFCSATPSTKISFNFSLFNVENCSGGCDYLYIYDGPTTASPLIGAFYDNITGSTQPFNLVSSPITSTGTCLTFRFTSDGSSNASGWAATISCIAVLPVELLYFKATQQNKSEVKLSWETASERNNNHFNIYKSNDAVNWQEIATVKGAGTSNQKSSYELIDSKPSTGISYYRLKQTDYNGINSFSNIVSVTRDSWNDSMAVVKIYPNPANGILNVEFSGIDNEPANLTITNPLRQVVLTAPLNRHGRGAFNISHFPTGIYFVTINNNTVKLIKN